MVVRTTMQLSAQATPTCHRSYRRAVAYLNDSNVRRHCRFQSLAAFTHGERGYVVVRNDPYFAITTADGRFEIKNLPAGEWEFRLWHERTGYLAASPDWPEGRRNLVIQDNQTTELDTIPIPAEVFESKP